MKKQTLKGRRMCLMSDGDGHYYVIPASLRNEFNQLLEESEAKDDHTEFCDEFDEYRINGPHTLTFTDPQED
jgi:hypothetical protein